MEASEIRKKIKKLSLKDLNILIGFYNKADWKTREVPLNDLLHSQELNQEEARYVLNKLVKLDLLEKYNSHICFYKCKNDVMLYSEIGKFYLEMLKNTIMRKEDNV